jgi:SM-20-related protein
MDMMRAMHISPENPMFAAVVDDLATHGWSQQALFLPADLVRALAAECRRRDAEGELNPAGVGRGDAQEVRESIRGDQIQWIDPGQAEACDQYLAAMDQLRQAINQGLFLGLEDFECHFALYPAGAFYRRHLDRFRDDDRRMVSAVLYLNEDWQPEDGGQLRMFLAGDIEHDVQPVAGCLAIFLSGEVPHEVLPARRERLSLTGWFRRRGNDPF